MGFIIRPRIIYVIKLAHDKATGEKPFLNNKYTIGNLINPNVGEINAFSLNLPIA